MTDLRIKIQIINSQENLIYKDIFNSAGTTTINNCTSNSGICASAARVKASAFVYLVGLNGAGTALNNTERDGYRDRALAYLRDVKIDGLNNTFDIVSALPGMGIINSIITFSPASIAAGLQWERMVWRSKELQMLCQAWDMLRWCYNIDPTLPNDNAVRSRLNDAAQQVIDNYATPLHKRAQSLLYQFAHNNYNLIVGSALASAGICFHDYGTYLPFINKKPDRWFSDIIESITSLWQPVWGKYTEGGSTNKSYPLACADRKTLL